MKRFLNYLATAIGLVIVCAIIYFFITVFGERVTASAETAKQAIEQAVAAEVIPAPEPAAEAEAGSLWRLRGHTRYPPGPARS